MNLVFLFLEEQSEPQWTTFPTVLCRVWCTSEVQSDLRSVFHNHFLLSLVFGKICDKNKTDTALKRIRGWSWETRTRHQPEFSLSPDVSSPSRARVEPESIQSWAWVQSFPARVEPEWIQSRAWVVPKSHLSGARVKPESSPSRRFRAEPQLSPSCVGFDPELSLSRALSRPSWAQAKCEPSLSWSRVKFELSPSLIWARAPLKNISRGRGRHFYHWCLTTLALSPLADDVLWSKPW